MTRHIFLSYVRENASLIDRLATDLRALGVPVWLDREGIMPGQRWRDAIREAIHDGGLFVACFSREYLTRESSYMNEELTIAIEELRLRPTDHTWFIPASLDGTNIPPRSIGVGETLADLQWVDLSSDWDRGVKMIAGLAGASAGANDPRGQLAAKIKTVPKSSTKFANAQATPKSPENFSQAILELVWRMPVWARIALVITVIAALALFALWKTLPDSTRVEQFKKLAGSGGDSTTPSALSTTTGAPSQGLEAATAISSSQAPRLPEAGVKRPNEPSSRLKPLTIDPVVLMAFYRVSDRTRLQADKLAAPYIDRWLKVSGTVGDVAGPPEDGATVYLDVPADTDRAPDTIVLHFPVLPQSSPVWILRKGQRVVALGRLTTVTDRFIMLKDCELVDD